MPSAPTRSPLRAASTLTTHRLRARGVPAATRVARVPRRETTPWTPSTGREASRLVMSKRPPRSRPRTQRTSSRPSAAGLAYDTTLRRRRSGATSPVKTSLVARRRARSGAIKSPRSCARRRQRRGRPVRRRRHCATPPLERLPPPRSRRRRRRRRAPRRATMDSSRCSAAASPPRVSSVNARPMQTAVLVALLAAALPEGVPAARPEAPSEAPPEALPEARPEARPEASPPQPTLRPRRLHLRMLRAARHGSSSAMTSTGAMTSSSG